MSEAADWGDPAALRLDGRWQPPRLLTETGSTNDDLIAWATQSPPPAGTWTLVAARAQRAGRGRRGRRWWSAPGGALLLTVATRLQLPAACWPRASLVVGEAVARALSEAADVDLGVRWPNDLMSRESPPRKVGGVLCERVSLPDGAALWLAGVGVNIRPLDVHVAPPGPDSLHDLGTQLSPYAVGVDTLRQRRGGAAEEDPPLRVEALLAPVALAIADAIDAWQRRGGRLLTDPLNARLLFRGAAVGLDLGDGARKPYWLDGVDVAGALRVRRVVEGAPAGPAQSLVPLRLLDAQTDPPWHHPPALDPEPG